MPARSCWQAPSTPQSLDPGRAVRRSATSRCSMTVASGSDAPRRPARAGARGWASTRCRAGCPPRARGAGAERAAATSASRKSAMTTVACAGTRAARAGARSRSISTATSRPTRGARASVSAPRPGPISRKVSVGEGAMAAITLSTQAGSRKCCPKRFLGRSWSRSSPDAPPSSSSSSSSSSAAGFASPAAPVALLDLLEFFLATARRSARPRGSASRRLP